MGNFICDFCKDNKILLVKIFLFSFLITFVILLELVLNEILNAIIPIGIISFLVKNKKIKNKKIKS